MLTELRQVLPLRLQITTAFLFLMWLFFQAYQPWESIDADLTSGTGQFNNVTDLSLWRREIGKVDWSDDTGYLRLHPTARFRFELPLNNGDLLLASARMRTEDVSPRRNQWDAGRIMVYFENARGEVNWKHPHDVGYAAGNTDWLTYRELIAVPYWAKRGWLELANYGTSGIVAFDDVSISPAVWKDSYKHLQMTFGMLWAAILMWLVLQAQLWSMPWGKLIMANLLVIVIGVTLPPTILFQVTHGGLQWTQKMLFTEPAQPAKAATSESSATVISEQKSRSEATITADPKPAKLSSPLDVSVSIEPRDLQKVGHVVLFSTLGFFVFMGLADKMRRGIMLYSIILFAASTEVLQLVVIGRTFSIRDFLIDLTGILIGVLLAFLWQVFKHEKAA